MEIPGKKWLDDREPFLGEIGGPWRNSTNTRLVFSLHGKLLLLEVLMVLMCVGAVIGNILVIVIVAATKTFHCVTSVLIINLAISDFLVGIGVMPFVAVSVLNNGWVNCTDLCLYVGYTSSVYCTASVLTLAAIALDRYYSIVDCLRYNSRCTVWRSGAAVVWIWLQAMLTSSPPLVGWSNVSFVAPMYSCAVNWASSPSYTVFMAAFSFLLPATVILFCYLKIVRVARHHAQRIHSIQEHLRHSRNHPTAVALEPVQRCSAMDLALHDPSRLVYYVSGRFVTEDLPRLGRESNSKRSRCFLHTLLTYLQSGQQQVGHPQHQGVVRLFMVIAAFFLCWTPYISVALVQAAETALSRSVSQVPPAAVTFSYWLVLFNSDINPLLYALLSKRFQGALQNLKRKIQARLQVVGRAVGGLANDANVIADNDNQHTRANVAHQMGSAYTSVFTMNATFPQNYREEAKNVLLPGSVLSPSSSSSSFSTSTSSCSLWPNCEGKKSESLQVPSRARDQDRMHSTSAIKERQATFFYGQITVRVEHDIS